MFVDGGSNTIWVADSAHSTLMAWTKSAGLQIMKDPLPLIIKIDLPLCSVYTAHTLYQVMANLLLSGQKEPRAG